MSTRHIPGLRAVILFCLVATALAVSPPSSALSLEPAGATFALHDVLSYPYPNELVASQAGTHIAWVFNNQGVRNIWVAEGPLFTPRQVTDYQADDGQELTNLSFSADGGAIVYVRGGDHDANWQAPSGVPPNPANSTVAPKVEIWVVPVDGGPSRLLTEGDDPIVSPRGGRLAFLRHNQVWSMPLDGSVEPKQLFFDRGRCRSLRWSPDGSCLAYVSNRGDHSFIALYTSEQEPVRYLAPSTAQDRMPRWSADGSRIAFVRRPGSGGAPTTILERHPQPWEIWVANVATGEARAVWKSPHTLLGSYPRTRGGANLRWAADDRLVFVADLDGWPHLYSLPASGKGKPLLLTPGDFMVEYVELAPDRRTLIYNANTGSDADDADRRHLFRVPVDAADPQVLTPGGGLEWAPVPTADGATLAFISAEARRPPLPTVLQLPRGKPRPLAEDQIPADFPGSRLVIPRAVVFQADDGVVVHGQIFEQKDGRQDKPAVIFVHGGPPRQMLLGWHYMEYYANAYAVNQYLATHGYIVLSVNYRLGIGYGHSFHHPDHAGPRGAAEYRDVLAGARFLQSQAGVDSKRIGIWGGSYGGYLTALALARNSDIFAAGVDLHGVHNWVAARQSFFAGRKQRYEKADVDEAFDVAWRSSPVSSISNWTSPVLLIHGDDDRNVSFGQTVELVQRLVEAGVPFEELVIPNEIHGFLKHSTWRMVDEATVRFFDQVFGLQLRNP